MDLGGTPAFTETFATVPRWTMRAILAILLGSAALSVVLLITESFRSAGQGLLVVSLPLLAAALIVIGASQTETKRIDDLTERFLRNTAADKLRDYLVDSDDRSAEPVLTPIFDHMAVTFDPPTPSWCRYRFSGRGQSAFQVVIKCNVLNFEVLMERCMPRDFWPVDTSAHLAIESVEDLAAHEECPAVAQAIQTLRGSLHEGYGIAIDARPGPEGTIVVWQIRQKLSERVILSPVMRRYFAEDAAIAAYFLSLETALATNSGPAAMETALAEPFRRAND